MNKKEKRLLDLFKIELKEIKVMMSEDLKNSIQNLIYNLNWDDTVYRTFNIGLTLMWKSKEENKLPVTLIEYIHKAHLSLILAVLRKLFEPARKGCRTVNSIPTIIKRIKENIGLWTRENYVCYDGIPYEKNETDDRKTKMIIINRHNKFDNMCIRNKKRNRKDKLSIEIIEKLEKNAILDDKIEKFVNNFLFHAASSDNRPNEADMLNKTTLLRKQQQMKKTVWIIQQISKIVDNLILTELATPQFEQLKGWDDSFFNKNIKNILYGYWEKRYKLWQDWSDKYWQTDEIYISLYKVFDG